MLQRILRWLRWLRRRWCLLLLLLALPRPLRLQEVSTFIAMFELFPLAKLYLPLPLLPQRLSLRLELGDEFRPRRLRYNTTLASASTYCCTDNDIPASFCLSTSAILFILLYILRISLCLPRNRRD